MQVGMAKLSLVRGSVFVIYKHMGICFSYSKTAIKQTQHDSTLWLIEDANWTRFSPQAVGVTCRL